jgi:hypothetical protein
VGSLERFRTDSVITQQGTEAGHWLRQQLEGPALPPSAAGVDDAFAALEAAFSSPPELAGVAPAMPELVRGWAPGFTSLPEASHLSVLPPGTPPAPAPSTLADLRCWLFGSPQHRRAS